jgi:hypothetical protein
MPIVAEPEKPAGEIRLTLVDLVDRFGPLPPGSGCCNWNGRRLLEQKR